MIIRAGGGGVDFRGFLQQDMKLQTKSLEPSSHQLAAAACTALAYHGSECMLGLEVPKTIPFCIYMSMETIFILINLPVSVNCLFCLSLTSARANQLCTSHKLALYQTHHAEAND